MEYKIDTIKGFIDEPSDLYTYLPLEFNRSHKVLKLIPDIFIKKAGNLNIVLSQNNNWKRPFEICSADGELMDILGKAAEFVNKDISSAYCSFLDKIDVKTFTAKHLIEYISRNVKDYIKIEDGPEFLNTREKLYRILNYLHNCLRSLPKSIINKAPLFLDNDGYLLRKDGKYTVYRMSEEKRSLIFNIISDYFALIDEEFEEKFSCLLDYFMVPFMPVNEIIDFLSEMSSDETYKNEYLNCNSIKNLYEFFAGEIPDEEEIDSLLSLPLFLTQKGSLKSPSEENLFLPGEDISDELLLDNIISEQVLNRDIKHFFIETLGIKELTFLNYLKDYVSVNYTEDYLDDKKRFNILKKIGKRYSSITDDTERSLIIEAIKNTELIKCDDNIYRKASHVFFPSKNLDKILSSSYPVPDKDLYKIEKEHYKKSFWYQLFANLGVKSTPSGKDILSHIKKIIHECNNENCESIKSLYNFLNENWKDYKDKDVLVPLRDLKWLPADGTEVKFYKPSELYLPRVRELVASQGRFLKFPEPKTDFRVFLNIQGDVRTADIVNHILWLSENKKPVSSNIYQKLYERRNEAEISKLKNRQIVWLNNRFWEQTKVFTGNCFEDFGKYRACLEGSNLENFADFFRITGVRNKSDKPEDYIEVIKEISSDFNEKSGKTLDKEDRRLLNNAYEKLASMEISQESLKELITKKSVLDDMNGLSLPDEVFIADRTSLLEKFDRELVRTVNVISQEGIGFLKKLGVREISRTVERELYEDTGFEKKDCGLSEKIPMLTGPVERIKRTLKKSITDLHVSTSLLKKLSVHRAGNIKVRYKLSLSEEKLYSQYYDEGSFYDSRKKIIFINGKGNPLVHLKKELERIIFPSLNIPNLIPLELFNCEPGNFDSLMDDMGYDAIVESKEIFEFPVKNEKFSLETEVSPVAVITPDVSEAPVISSIEELEDNKEIVLSQIYGTSKDDTEISNGKINSPRKTTDYPALAEKYKLPDNGEVEKKKEIRKCEKPAEDKERPVFVKFILSFLNRTRGFLSLHDSAQKLFPEGKKEFTLVTDSGIEFPVYIDRINRRIYNSSKLRDYFISEDIPAGGIVYIEHLNSSDKYRIYYKEKPALYKAVKLASVIDGKLSYDYVDMEVNCETAGQIFISEKRLEDQIALFLEGEDKKSIFETIITVFEMSGSSKLHQQEICELVYTIRMVSYKSILSELHKRPCFINSGDCQWTYKPEKGLKYDTEGKSIGKNSQKHVLLCVDKAFRAIMEVFSGKKGEELEKLKELFGLIRSELEKLV
jgi:hypothetical protein